MNHSKGRQPFRQALSPICISFQKNLYLSPNGSSFQSLLNETRWSISQRGPVSSLMSKFKLPRATFPGTSMLLFRHSITRDSQYLQAMYGPENGYLLLMTKIQKTVKWKEATQKQGQPTLQELLCQPYLYNSFLAWSPGLRARAKRRW